jgi:hypothetical protein
VTFTTISVINVCVMRASRMKEPKKDNSIRSSVPSRMHPHPPSIANGVTMSSAHAAGAGSSDSVATDNNVNTVDAKEKRLTTTAAPFGSAAVCLSVGSLVQQPSLGGMMRVELRNHIQVRRVSCKARGMGESHAPQTAYFDISLDARHGEVCDDNNRCMSCMRDFFILLIPTLPICHFSSLHRLWSALIPRAQGAVEDSGIALFVNAR